MKFDQVILGVAVGAILTWVISHFTLTHTVEEYENWVSHKASELTVTKLRIQTHFGPETLRGQLVKNYVDTVETMSEGRIEIEMLYASSAVKPADTFRAAAEGTLDCDMTSPTYQINKDPAFQFVGDIIGGYTTPYQQLSWLYLNNGLAQAQKLYDAYGMQLVGWVVPASESLSSNRSIQNIKNIKGWRFRSPPGLEANIFETLGASPVVMSFEDGFKSLKSGLLDGADVSTLANNFILGIYDIAEYATYPGFHSQPTDHLACRKEVWDKMPQSHRKIMSVAMESLALQTALMTEARNAQVAVTLRKKGITLQSWSAGDLLAFRNAAQSAWAEMATTPESKALVASHTSYLKQLGLLE